MTERGGKRGIAATEGAGDRVAVDRPASDSDFAEQAAVTGTTASVSNASSSKRQKLVQKAESSSQCSEPASEEAASNTSSCVSNLESHESGCGDGSSTEESASHVTKSQQKRPVQFKLMYRSRKRDTKPIAMERFWNDKKETFSVDAWREGGLFLNTDGLPDELLKLTNWKPKAWEQLESMFQNVMKGVILTDNRQWSLQKGVEDKFTETDVEKLMKKYDLLPMETVYHCIQYRRALLTTPSLGNTYGRVALFNLCTMLCDLLPLPYKHRCYPVNVGGDAWPGNTKIGYIYSDKGMTDEELTDLLPKRACVTQNTKIRACDLQVIDPLTNTSYWITGGTKQQDDINGAENEWKARRQAWEQALPGLRFEDESYAILLTPKEAQLFQLRLFPSPCENNEGRRLITYTTKYNFIDKQEESVSQFATDEFGKLMADIMGVMFRGSKSIRNRTNKQI